MDMHDQLIREEAFERYLKRKRDAFLEEHDLSGKPAFIWQCMPLEKVAVDVGSQGVQNAIGQGIGTESDNGWWYGFRSSTLPSLVFDGIASSRLADSGWATQLHADGHLMAALWSFPTIRRQDGARQTALPTFFAEAFRDYGRLVRNCYEAASYAGQYALTCTLEQSDQLCLAGERENIIAPPVKRRTLRWPLFMAFTAEDANAATYQMGLQLMRAYGKSKKPW